MDPRGQTLTEVKTSGDDFFEQCNGACRQALCPNGPIISASMDPAPQKPTDLAILKATHNVTQSWSVLAAQLSANHRPYDRQLVVVDCATVIGDVIFQSLIFCCEPLTPKRDPSVAWEEENHPPSFAQATFSHSVQRKALVLLNMAAMAALASPLPSGRPIPKIGQLWSFVGASTRPLGSQNRT